MDRLARRLARALADPGVPGLRQRSSWTSRPMSSTSSSSAVSPRSDRRALQRGRPAQRQREATVEADADAAIPLEFYFPVPAHRAAWTGGPDLLVASAREDHEAPIAYDVDGRRQVSVPTASHYSGAGPRAGRDRLRTRRAPWRSRGPPPAAAAAPAATPSPPTGLFMTYAHFVQDFEGWFKGNPEYEIHILGQAGTSDSLADYQCAGEPAGGYYRFDQNSLTWSGQVLLFSQAQLNNYKAAHPNQNFRIIALEDDDTGCVIKFDAEPVQEHSDHLQSSHPNLTGGKDTLSAYSGSSSNVPTRSRRSSRRPTPSSPPRMT